MLSALVNKMFGLFFANFFVDKIHLFIYLLLQISTCWLVLVLMLFSSYRRGIVSFLIELLIAPLNLYIFFSISLIKSITVFSFSTFVIGKLNRCPSCSKNWTFIGIWILLKFMNQFLWIFSRPELQLNFSGETWIYVILLIMMH